MVIQEIFFCHVLCRMTGSKSSARATDRIFLLSELRSCVTVKRVYVLFFGYKVQMQHSIKFRFAWPSFVLVG